MPVNLASSNFPPQV